MIAVAEREPRAYRARNGDGVFGTSEANQRGNDFGIDLKIYI